MTHKAPNGEPIATLSFRTNNLLEMKGESLTGSKL